MYGNAVYSCDCHLVVLYSFWLEAALIRHITDERMYQAGLLKIAMRMRLEKDKSFEQVLREVTQRLRLEPEGFRRYVQTNMKTLMATVKKQRP
jgi:hypothetical protein